MLLFRKWRVWIGKDLTYTMLPFQENFAYSVKRNEEIVAEDCWENCEQMRPIPGVCFVPAEHMFFVL